MHCALHDDKYLERLNFHSFHFRIIAILFCSSNCYKQTLSIGPLLLNGPINRPRIVLYYYWDYGQWSVLWQCYNVVDSHSYPGTTICL